MTVTGGKEAHRTSHSPQQTRGARSRGALQQRELSRCTGKLCLVHAETPPPTASTLMTNLQVHYVQPSMFLTDQQLADRWGISAKTLRNARVAGSYIPFVRIGRLIRYRLSDVESYEAAQTRQSTTEGGQL